MIVFGANPFVFYLRSSSRRPNWSGRATPRRRGRCGAARLVAVGLRVDAAPLLVVALVLTGFGFGLPFGPLFSLAFARVGSDAGVLLVGMTALGNAAALAYPWLVGWLLGVTDGYVVGFAVMSLSVLAVTALWQRAVDAP